MWIRRRSLDTVHSHRFEDLDNGDFDKNVAFCCCCCLFVLLSGSRVGRWPRRSATAAGKEAKGRRVCWSGVVGRGGGRTITGI